MIPHALPVTGRAAYAQDGAREADGYPSCSSACYCVMSSCVIQFVAR
jgi:hypothetical protein